MAEHRPELKWCKCKDCARTRMQSRPDLREKRKISLRKQREIMKADPEKHAARKEYQRQYGAANRERLSAQSIAAYRQPEENIRIRLKRKKITPTPELIAHIRAHDGSCDLCGESGDGRWENLSIDHCHDTQAFRGLLCSKCNRGLGFFRDNPDLLKLAAEYAAGQFRKTVPGECFTG